MIRLIGFSIQAGNSGIYPKSSSLTDSGSWLTNCLSTDSERPFLPMYFRAAMTGPAAESAPTKFLRDLMMIS